MLVARYGRFFDAFLRAFVLWRIARALRQGFRRIFLRAFYVLWYIGCTPRGGFSTFFCAFFVFVGGFARFGAILAKRRRREKQIAKRQVRYEDKRQKKRRRREKSQRQRKGKRKSQRQRKGEREKKRNEVRCAAVNTHF